MQPQYRPSAEIWIALAVLGVYLAVVLVVKTCDRYHASLPGWVCQPRPTNQR